MLDSILIEMTRGLMSYGTVIAPVEPSETAFPTSNWFLMFLVVLSIGCSDDSSTLTVEFTYREACC